MNMNMFLALNVMVQVIAADVMEVVGQTLLIQATDMYAPFVAEKRSVLPVKAQEKFTEK
jgi:hypothetical protein